VCGAKRLSTIYEINTWVWLSDVAVKAGRPIDLSSVPAAEWDAIAAYGFDAVWLMGVWERSPFGTAIANHNASLIEEFRRTLSDFRPEDNVGSAYCVRRYVVDSHLGGPEGLKIARQELAGRGIKLLLDFVPNHVAPDAPWIVEHPEHFLQGSAAEFANAPDCYLNIAGKIFACGKDPYFPPWPDVVQANAFEPGFRDTVIALISSIAEQCDGIRCDMAMLLINNIFARTWGARAGSVPATEYWPEVIQAVREEHPGFVFIAEAYWDLEWTLQQQGFDFCYDKRLYDRLERSDVSGTLLHLSGDGDYQRKLIRFLENHDEPRVATAFPFPQGRVAAIATATLLGAKLFYEGQFEGRKSHVPVFLGRRPEEPLDEACLAFYQKLLAAVNVPVFRDGQWELCKCTGWPDNMSFQKLGAWSWRDGEDRRLVIVNLCGSPVQARVHVPWGEVDGKQWRLDDALSDATYVRDGSEIWREGLYIELLPWTGQIFSFLPV
jgi:hypothetical protein